MTTAQRIHALRRYGFEDHAIAAMIGAEVADVAAFLVDNEASVPVTSAGVDDDSAFQVVSEKGQPGGYLPQSADAGDAGKYPDAHTGAPTSLPGGSEPGTLYKIDDVLTLQPGWRFPTSEGVDGYDNLPLCYITGSEMVLVGDIYTDNEITVFPVHVGDMKPGFEAVSGFNWNMRVTEDPANNFRLQIAGGTQLKYYQPTPPLAANDGIFLALPPYRYPLAAKFA